MRKIRKKKNPYIKNEPKFMLNTNNLTVWLFWLLNEIERTGFQLS